MEEKVKRESPAIFCVSLLFSMALLGWIWSIIPQGLVTGIDGRMIRSVAVMIGETGNIWSPVNLSSLQGAYNLAYPFGLMFTSTWPFAFFEPDTARYVTAFISLAFYCAGIVALGRAIGLSWMLMPVAVTAPAMLHIYPFQYEFGASILFLITPGAFVVIGLCSFILALLLRYDGGRWSMAATYVAIAVLAIWAIVAEPLWAGLFALAFAPCGFIALITKGSRIALHGAILIGIAALLWISGPLEYLYLTLTANARSLLNHEMGRVEISSLVGASAVFSSKTAFLIHVYVVFGLMSGFVLNGRMRIFSISGFVVLLLYYASVTYYLVLSTSWPLPLPIYLETATFHVFIVIALKALSVHVERALPLFGMLTLKAKLVPCLFVAVAVPAGLFAYGLAIAPKRTTIYVEQDLRWQEAAREIAAVTSAQAFGERRGSVAAIDTDLVVLQSQLWLEGVRTMNEYSQTVTPIPDLMTSRLAYDSPIPMFNQLRFDRYNRNLSASFGVEYVITSQANVINALTEVATVRLANDGNVKSILRIEEFQSPLTPSRIMRVGSLQDVIAILRADEVSLYDVVLLEQDWPEPIVGATGASLRYHRGSIFLDIRSAGASITVLPALYSRCWRIADAGAGALLKVNGGFLGVATEGNASLEIEFAMSILRPKCRRADVEDWRVDIRSMPPMPAVVAKSIQRDHRGWRERLRRSLMETRW